VDASKELVRRAQTGDHEAFSALVVEYQSFVFNLALRAIGDPREAEDIAQEAFVRAWQALPRFRGQAQFRTWLYRIVTNLCYTRRPRLRRELADVGTDDVATLLDGSWRNPVDQMERAELRRFLHHQIALLPQAQRMLLMLRFQQELSYEDIAAIVDMPLGTVKTGIFRARLRAALAQYEGGTHE
jgi:RNA polymerase sigma-70 factor (ECF subfamily)